MPSASAGADAPAPLISNEQIRHLYVTLLRSRRMRERNRLKGARPALVAREAIVTGTVAHLKAGDTLMPAPGDQVAALARGLRLRKVLASVPLPGILRSAPSVATQYAVATGHALAQQTGAITLVFSGTGVGNLADLQATFAYAATQKPGVIFVLEAEKALELGTDTNGICTIPVDGNDVLAVYRVAQEAISRARRGVGPTILDCRPWPLPVRKADADPVTRLEQALSRRGLETAKLKERTIAAFQREWDALGKSSLG